MHSPFRNHNFCAPSKFGLKRLVTSLAATGFALAAPGASAEVVLATKTGATTQLEQLPTGDQLIFEDYSGSVLFGGHILQLEAFSGVLGYSAEVAYAVTFDGTARIDGRHAKPGRMLLIAPFGRGTVSERFDAKRLHQSLSESSNSASIANVLTRLNGLATRQGRGVFLGRLGRTSFNVATFGSSEAEVDRRSRVGGTAVRKARFAASASGDTTERTIIESFIAALTRGDAIAASQFLDPLPYGYGSLQNGGDEARQAMARSLISKEDWSGFSSATVSKTDETQWMAKSNGKVAVIVLRRTSDFAFVQSIQVGE